MNNAPLLSFITICYNGIADTCALIESIHKIIHSVSYEIIVVDNASREDEAAIIKMQYPTVITVRSPQNLGFSGGNNLGFEIAQGKYLFLINNDTYFETDGIQALINRLESHSEIGAVSPKICFAFPPQHIQFAGYTPLSSITMRNEPIGMGCPDDGSFFDVPHPSPYLHGAAMLIKREVVNRVGPMPEIYFLYYEELDWCTAMTRAGYVLWYEPLCTVFHKESQRPGQYIWACSSYPTRNRLLYSWRNFTGMRCSLSILYQMTVAAGKNSLVYLLKRRSDLAFAVWKGVFAFFSLPNKKN